MVSSWTKDNMKIKKCFMGWFVVVEGEGGEWLYKSATMRSYEEALNYVDAYRDDK